MEELNVLKLNRILAALIDGLILFVLFFAVFTYPLIDFILRITEGSYSPENIVFLSLFAIGGFALGILYLFVSSLIFKGATIGMKITHLVYVTTDGTSPRAATLFNRSSLLIISLVLSFGLVAIIDLICILLNDWGKDFHDIYSNLKVVSDYDF